MTLVTKYQISAINSYWEKYLGRTDRGKTVYPCYPSGSRGIMTITWRFSNVQMKTILIIHRCRFDQVSDSYFLFADFVDFYTHWTYILYMPIFSCIFLSNYWWQKSDIWSQASYRYPISWEAFLDPSDSYFLFAEERGYHKWALAHSSSCWM
jgi:hypothetical protein